MIVSCQLDDMTLGSPSSKLFWLKLTVTKGHLWKQYVADDQAVSFSSSFAIIPIFLETLSAAGIGLEEPEVVLPPQRLGVNYDVVNPDLYVDEEGKSRVFPQSKEEFDPEIDLSFDDEGMYVWMVVYMYII